MTNFISRVVKQGKSLFQGEDLSAKVVEEKVKLLTESDAHSLFGRVIDTIKMIFGCKGTLGDAVHLAYCLRKFEKYVSQRPLTFYMPIFSTRMGHDLNLSSDAFVTQRLRTALKSRVTQLGLPVSENMLRACLKYRVENRFETFSSSTINAIVNTVLPKGYFTKTNITITGLAATALAVVGLNRYRNS